MFNSSYSYVIYTSSKLFLSYDKVFALNNVDQVLMTRVRGDYAPVFINTQNRITCQNCRTKFPCKHVTMVRSSGDDNAVELVKRAGSSPRYQSINLPEVYASRKVILKNKNTIIEGISACTKMAPFQVFTLDKHCHQ